MQTLKKALAEGKPGKCYIFHGEETYLRDHYVSQLRKGRETRRLEASCGLDEIYSACSSFGFGEEDILVELRDFDLFKADETAEALPDLLASLPEGSVLLFVYDAIEYKPDKRKKTFKTIEKLASTIEFKRQSDNDLINWINRRFGALDKGVSRDTAKFLIDYCGFRMSTLANEIAKAAAFSKAPLVTPDDIRAVGIPTVEAGAFELADCITRADKAGAARTLAKLLELNEEAVMLVGALSWQMRKLYIAKLCVINNQSAKISQIAGISPGQAGRMARTVSRPPLAWYGRAVRSCAACDRRLKSSSADNKVILTDLLLELVN
ncbi:MAG: DNA polymerase III subunit delta [Oscillospiraceae bacterium]|jgi:DNA polymerase-3 subunit delta|nr:DNA polymerase III subunit delta [Oscillospiraceae bacterium]